MRLIQNMTLMAVGLAAVTAHADTIYVCWDGSGDYLTIQEGIDAAQDGDEVVVCDGTYTGPLNKNLDFGGRLITVRSASGDPALCIIDCEKDGRGFYFGTGETGDAIVDGFTITNGYVVGGYPYNFGGGIHCRNSSPAVTNCIIIGNTAGLDDGVGGGICCQPNADATITNCMIADNSAYWGGGIAFVWSNEPTILDCTITENEGTLGGGAYLQNTSSTVAHCIIAGNAAAGGAGMLSVNDSVTIADCVVTQNTAWGEEGACGGGVAFAGSVGHGYQRMINCRITGNTANKYGGGLWTCESHATIATCTVAGNVAGIGGGGLCSAQGGADAISDGILWRNSASQGPEIWVGLHQVNPGTLGVFYCNVEGGESDAYVDQDCTLNWGPGNIDSDPLFVDPDGPDDDPYTWEDNDYHLSPGSPCIDAGCNGGVPPDVADLDNDDDTSEVTPLDLDGEGRFFDDPDTPDTGCGFVPIVDMGAYEFGNTGPQPCPGDLDGDRDVDHSDLGILLSLWGATDECDLDCDGDIDHADLGILLAHWYEGCP